jgi:hypothetical protein
MRLRRCLDRACQLQPDPVGCPTRDVRLDWSAEAKGDANAIFQVRGNPKDASEFVTIGSKCIMF